MTHAFSKPAVSQSVSNVVCCVHARIMAASLVESKISRPSLAASFDCKCLCRYGLVARSVDRSFVPRFVYVSILGLIPWEKKMRLGISSFASPSGVMGGGGGRGGPSSVVKSKKRSW